LEQRFDILGIRVVQTILNNEISVWNVTVLNGDFFVGKRGEKAMQGMALWRKSNHNLLLLDKNGIVDTE